ncbi:bestrophin-4 isoform X2 [Lingula anatina]|uniref:Bestrophin homolog n=1 Tax=Lingula anatina TaxID=7574 RepID=A0A1S3JCD2_LINAN|nr:bestrophin-4 isoform X2 [Lingula anatina]|eukprot:XP_013407846.1 bestrophin-4 isoform X2 [Lingula anatina]
MTVTYSSRVASVSNVASFFKLLIRWKGSVIKLVLVDLIIFLVLYFIFNFTYRFGLNPAQKRTFESIASYCNQNTGRIPVAFILGFYVVLVIQRWLQVLRTLPWPNRMSFFTTTLVHGDDEMGRLMRRTIQRYLTLSTVLLTRDTCPPVRKRFPTLQHVVDAGLMTDNEMHVYENIPAPQAKYWVPLVWSTALVTRARKEGRIKDDISAQTMIVEIDKYRGYLMALFNYDWIPIPLIYTQVTTLSVYTYFLACLMGAQFLDVETPQNWIDMKVPIFTVMQFVFYVGWLKVAECMLNPLGEDDDDFEINYIIDCGFELSMLAVELHGTLPEMDKDVYWEKVEFDLPYTAAAEKFKVEPHLGSAIDLVVSPKVSEFLQDGSCSSIPDEEASPSIIRRRHPSKMQRIFSNRSRHMRPRRQLSRTTSSNSQTSGQSNVHDRPLEPQSLKQEDSQNQHRFPKHSTVLHIGEDDPSNQRDPYSHRLDSMISHISDVSGRSADQDFTHTVLEAVIEESNEMEKQSDPRCGSGEVGLTNMERGMPKEESENLREKHEDQSAEELSIRTEHTDLDPSIQKDITPGAPSVENEEKMALLTGRDEAEDSATSANMPPASQSENDETDPNETTSLLK